MGNDLVQGDDKPITMPSNNSTREEVRRSRLTEGGYSNVAYRIVINKVDVLKPRSLFSRCCLL